MSNIQIRSRKRVRSRNRLSSSSSSSTEGPDEEGIFDYIDSCVINHTNRPHHPDFGHCLAWGITGIIIMALKLRHRDHNDVVVVCRQHFSPEKKFNNYVTYFVPLVYVC